MFGNCTENCWETGAGGIWFLSILAPVHPLLYTKHKFGFCPYWHHCIPYFTLSTNLVFVHIGTIASPTLHKAHVWFLPILAPLHPLLYMKHKFGFCPYWHHCIPYFTRSTDLVFVHIGTIASPTLHEAQIWFLSILAPLHPLLYTKHKFGFCPYWHHCIPYFTRSTNLVFVHIGTSVSPTLHEAQIWFLSILAPVYPLLYMKHKFGFCPYWHHCIPYFT